MKKLSIISNQIQNNTYSYTGKGSFEAVVNNNKDLVIDWLEELIPLQKQIEQLSQLSNLTLQKRNYTRILTKILPDQYKEFVSLNILVRDANVVAQYYNNEFNITLLYDKLINSKYLKYPGKYEKYVDFNIFQKFIMMYRDDLLKSLETGHQEFNKTIINSEDKPTKEKQQEKNILQEMVENKDEETVENNEQTHLEIEPEVKQEIESKTDTKKETNWTNLLLGRLK